MGIKNIKQKSSKVLILVIILNVTFFSFNTLGTQEVYGRIQTSDWTIGVSVGDKHQMNETFCNGACESITGVGTLYNFEIVEINANTIKFDRTLSKTVPEIPDGTFTLARTGYDDWESAVPIPLTTTNFTLISELVQSNLLGNRNVSIISQSDEEIKIHESYDSGTGVTVNGNFTYEKSTGWLSYSEFIIFHGSLFYTEVHITSVDNQNNTTSADNQNNTTSGGSTPGFNISIVLITIFSFIIKKKKEN